MLPGWTERSNECLHWTMQSNSDVLASLPADRRLAARTAIVTGSTSGIGAATARVLAASGATVVVSGRDAVRAQVVVDAIVGAGGAAHP
jgi:3-oxoacyl-[acyl-carrier protein] reductase